MFGTPSLAHPVLGDSRLNLDTLAHEVRSAVREAACRIESFAAEGVTATHKADLSPVTAADRAADKLLKTRLLELLPCAWLSEETADDRKRLAADHVWVVDPLDGTKEFVRGLPEYSVAVALVEHGEPVLAVVRNPRTQEEFFAVRGGGAFSSEGQTVVADGSTLLASRSEIERGEFAQFQADWDVKPVGSIEYKLALIAAGRAAATFSRGPKYEWDVCAGSLIVAEAGGHVTDLFGAPMRFNQPFPKVKGVVAGAPRAYNRARAQLAEVGASDRMGEFADVKLSIRKE